MQESKTCWDVHQYWFLSIQLRSLSCPVMLDWELSHITEEGKNAIAYVSQPLASAEQNYPHLEKEGLTVIFGVKKNHQYLYGYKFFIYTDLKPFIVWLFFWLIIQTEHTSTMKFNGRVLSTIYDSNTCSFKSMKEIKDFSFEMPPLVYQVLIHA